LFALSRKNNTKDSKAIIDKVIVRTSVSFSFVLINGMEFAIDGRKYNDGRKYKNHTRH